MDKFRVGQKVRFIKATSNRFVNQIGEIVTIEKFREWHYTQSGKPSFAYILTDDSTVEEWQLEPVYDGDVASSWSESVWKPKELIKD